MDSAAASDLKISLPSLRDEVYGHLRRRILDHIYPPGYRFDLNQLETQFGVSLTPLKEAMHRLEAEGLVEIRPRRGTFVTRIDADEVAESFDVRRILECAALEIVAPRITDAQLAELVELDAQMGALLAEPDYQAIVAQHIDLDWRLHQRLMELAGNRRLLSIYGQIDTHLQVARLHDQFQPRQSNDTRREHALVLNALRARSARDAVEAMAAHIETSKRRTLDALRQSMARQEAALEGTPGKDTAK